MLLSLYVGVASTFSIDFWSSKSSCDCPCFTLAAFCVSCPYVPGWLFIFTMLARERVAVAGAANGWLVLDGECTEPEVSMVYLFMQINWCKNV